MPTELAERRSRLAELFPEHEVDGLAVTSLANVRYLSGFTGSNAVLLLAPGFATLFTDPRYTIQAEQESDCTVRVEKGSLIAAAGAAILRKKWKSVAFERN